MSALLPAQTPTNQQPRRLLDRRSRLTAWMVIGGLSLLLVFVYLDSLRLVASVWETPQYSHGFLIPMVAGVLLWLRSKPLVEATPAARWCGVGLIAAASVIRVISAYYTTIATDNVSLIPCLVGVILLVGGWDCLKWAGLPIAFLTFMYPWPDALESLILVNLKENVAMPVSLFLLQTLGVEAYLSGNIIELGDGTKMNVVDACAGLGMLNIFLALAAAFAMIVTWRPTWERWVLFLSAVPIALIANALRITSEGLIFYYGEVLVSAATAEAIAGVFHDYLASWFMMVIALGLLYIEYHLLQRLVIEEEVHHTLGRHLPKREATAEG